MTDARLESLWSDGPSPSVDALLAEVFRGEPWMAQAECGRTLDDGTPVYDRDLWHPPMGHSVEPAREVCLGCPVREPCLDYAMRTKQQFGVWGGKSVMERRALRRDRSDDGE